MFSQQTNSSTWKLQQLLNLITSRQFVFRTFSICCLDKRLVLYFVTRVRAFVIISGNYHFISNLLFSNNACIHPFSVSLFKSTDSVNGTYRHAIARSLTQFQHATCAHSQSSSPTLPSCPHFHLHDAGTHNFVKSSVRQCQHSEPHTLFHCIALYRFTLSSWCILMICFRSSKSIIMFLCFAFSAA